MPISLPECSNAVKNRKILSSGAPSNLDQKKKRYSMDIHTQQTESIPRLQANRRRSHELPRCPVRANNQLSQMKQIVQLHAHAVRSMQEQEQQLRCMQMHMQLEPPDGGSRRSSSSSMQNRSVMSNVLEIHDNFQGMIVDLKVNRNANEQSSSLEFH